MMGEAAMSARTWTKAGFVRYLYPQSFAWVLSGNDVAALCRDISLSIDLNKTMDHVCWMFYGEEMTICIRAEITPRLLLL